MVEQVRHENRDSKAKSAFWEGLQPVRTTEEAYPTPPKRSQSPRSNSLSLVPQSTLELLPQKLQTDREIDFAPNSLDLDSRQPVATVFFWIGGSALNFCAIGCPESLIHCAHFFVDARLVTRDVY